MQGNALLMQAAARCAATVHESLLSSSILYRMIPLIWRAVKAVFLRRQCLSTRPVGWNARKPARWN